MARVSSKKDKNIYQQTRENLELSRESASELLEWISPERIERIENEKSLRGEFFRVVKALDVSDEQKQQILKLGFCALEGREANDDQD